MISLLYVDDEPDLLELTQIFLERTGEFRVRTSLSAEGILEDPETFSCDAIISDYQMPGMDGITFLKEIRKRSGDLPFLLFTGRGREEVVIEAFNNGADFYIQKGGDPRAQFAELANKIRYAVTRRRAEKELQKKSDELNASYEQIAANEEELRQQLDELTAKQEALTLSEEKFRAFTENIPDLTTISDINGNYRYISPSIQRITGQSGETLVGKKYAGVSTLFGIVAEDTDILLTSGRTAIESPGTPITVPPFRVKDFHGEHVFIEGTITYLPDVKGIQGLLFHGRDITDRVRAEEEISQKAQELRVSCEQLTTSEEKLRGQYEELVSGQKRTRESEERFRTLFEKIHEALFIFTGSHFLDCNQLALELFGYGTKEEFLALGPADLFPPSQPDGQESLLGGEIHYRKTLAEGADHFEWIHKKKDGSLFSSDVLLSKFELDGVQMVLASVRDISDRKRIEDELQLLKISVDRSSDEVFWLGFDGSIRYVNDAACRITGYSREELCSMKLFELDPDFSQDGWDASIADLREKKTQFFTTRHQRKDGTILDVEILSIYVSKDNQEYSFAFVRDITGRKTIEQALQDTNKKLNLLNSITRHDVANQLTVLQGYVQLAGARNQDPVMLDFLKKIELATDTISRQIEFTKNYQDLGVRTPSWFRLEDIFETTARPGISFSKTCLATEIYADPMIERVFFNLFDNAIQHGEHVTAVSVRCERAPDGLVILVEDNGIGIAPEEKEKIFGKAYGKNTGFGLFLAREILAITGITIRETGYLGIGARFEITVPKERWRTMPAG